MGKTGKANFSDLNKLQRNLKKLSVEAQGKFADDCAKELSARVLTKVIKRTPAGDYTKEVTKTAKRDSKKHKKGDVYTETVADGSGRKGGVLRRGWTAKTYEEAKNGKGSPSKADVDEFLKNVTVERSGNRHRIVITNPVPYASYVENGHKQKPGRYVPVIGKQLKQGWVIGRFMLKRSVEEIEKIQNQVIEAKLKKVLGDAFQ